MINIRRYIFETNSSSMDHYGDFDDYQTEPFNCGFGIQNVTIELQFIDGLTDERHDEIFDIIKANEEKFTDILDYLYNHKNTRPEFYDLDDNELILSYYAYLHVYYNTRKRIYEIDEYEGVPEKNEEYKEKEQDKEKFMKLFAELGITEVTGIINIYGDAVEEIDELDND